MKDKQPQIRRRGLISTQAFLEKAYLSYVIVKFREKGQKVCNLVRFKILWSIYRPQVLTGFLLPTYNADYCHRYYKYKPKGRHQDQDPVFLDKLPKILRFLILTKF